jgi:CarD family transcriptional regulator
MSEVFSPGDKVVHKRLGGGYIKAIAKKEIGGEKINCLEIDLILSNARAYVPLSQAGLEGLRKPINPEEIALMKGTLLSSASELDGDWKSRAKHLRDKLCQGDPYQIAEIIRDLYPGAALDKLTATEKAIMEKAKHLLASEVSLVEEVTLEEAVGIIENTIGDRG